MPKAAVIGTGEAHYQMCGLRSTVVVIVVLWAFSSQLDRQWGCLVNSLVPLIAAEMAGGAVH